MIEYLKNRSRKKRLVAELREWKRIFDESKRIKTMSFHRMCEIHEALNKIDAKE